MNRRIALFISLILLASGLGAETGIASWYGGKFQGRLTANGEIFDTAELTAAHKTLAFNTLVRVTNQSNGKTVIVRINDRGPFVEGRIIDLSRAAARKIGVTKTGIAPVVLEILRPGDGKTYHHAEVRPRGTLDLDPIQADPAPKHIVQAASFGDEVRARTLAASLRREGLEAVLESVPDRGLYRVVIPDLTRPQAEATREKLIALGFSGPLIRTVR